VLDLLEQRVDDGSDNYIVVTIVGIILITIGTDDIYIWLAYSLQPFRDADFLVDFVF